MTNPLVVEIVSESSKSFEEATRLGIVRARQTHRNVCGAWIAGQIRAPGSGGGMAYRVTMKITCLRD
jgi:flavin-binding protein dodecin